MSESRRDPVIRPIPILDLRPTQITVGMREVERKRKAWGDKDDKQQAADLEKHMVPVVLGPGGERYITDHHHLARALFDHGQKEVFVAVIGDLSKADPEHFWNLMDYHGWTHPFDEKGRRCGYGELPKSVRGMKDDPYRALSGALRRVGGFAKDSTPFSEFVWADFFRRRIKPKISRTISKARWKPPCRSPSRAGPTTCRAGADRMPRAALHRRLRRTGEIQLRRSGAKRNNLSDELAACKPKRLVEEATVFETAICAAFAFRIYLSVTT